MGGKDRGVQDAMLPAGHGSGLRGPRQRTSRSRLAFQPEFCFRQRVQPAPEQAIHGDHNRGHDDG